MSLRRVITKCMSAIPQRAFASIKDTKKINRVFITGANGQLGTDLLPILSKIYGSSNILATDVNQPKVSSKNWDYKILNVLNTEELESTIKTFKPDLIMHMAAILSANGEKNPALCYQVNCIGYKNVLDLATKYKTMLFCPSTIAAFGPTTPMNAEGKVENTTIQRPITMYGVSKVYNELLGNYYKLKFGLDYRALRYPQVISNVKPGGGSGDCFIEVFKEALTQQKYLCYLKEDQKMPLIYIDDLIVGTLKLLETDKSKLTDIVYNIQGDSFSMKTLAEALKKNVPSLKVDYKPDFRQKIVETWPQSLDDKLARKDWNWAPKFQMKEMKDIMLKKVSESLASEKKSDSKAVKGEVLTPEYYDEILSQI